MTKADTRAPELPWSHSPRRDDVIVLLDGGPPARGT